MPPVVRDDPYRRTTSRSIVTGVSDDDGVGRCLSPSPLGGFPFRHLVVGVPRGAT